MLDLASFRPPDALAAALQARFWAQRPIKGEVGHSLKLSQAGRLPGTPRQSCDRAPANSLQTGLSA